MHANPTTVEIIIFSIIISSTIISCLSGITGFLNTSLPIPERDSGIIENWKNDARKFRLIPKIIWFYFIYLMEYSYKFGIFLGKCLKFLFIKDSK